MRRNRKPLQSNAAVLQKVRDEFPVKTAVYLSDLTGQPVRTCEYWIANQTLSPEAIWALLRSERGLQFLIAGMDGARPQWFAQLLRIGAVSSVMRRRDADLRLIRRVLGADDNLAAALDAMSGRNRMEHKK